MPQKIVPNLWFDHNAEEAGAFYAAALPNTTSRVVARYPDEVPDWQASFAGQALTVDLDVDGFRFTLINAGSEFRPNRRSPSCSTSTRWPSAMRRPRAAPSTARGRRSPRVAPR